MTSIIYLEREAKIELPIENFALSGVAAVVSKTAAAPIERVKLLVQNQGEMLETRYNHVDHTTVSWIVPYANVPK